MCIKIKPYEVEKGIEYMEIALFYITWSELVQSEAESGRMNMVIPRVPTKNELKTTVETPLIKLIHYIRKHSPKWKIRQ